MIRKKSYPLIHPILIHLEKFRNSSLIAINNSKYLMNTLLLRALKIVKDHKFKIIISQN